MDYTISVISFLSPALAFAFTLYFSVLFGAGFYVLSVVGFDTKKSTILSSAIALTFSLIVVLAVMYINAWEFSKKLIMIHEKSEVAEASGLMLNKDFEEFQATTKERQSVTGFFEKVGLYSDLNEAFKETLKDQRPFVPIKYYPSIKDYLNLCLSKTQQQPVLEALNYYPASQEEVNRLVNEVFWRAKDSNSLSTACQLSFGKPSFIQPLEKMLND